MKGYNTFRKHMVAARKALEELLDDDDTVGDEDLMLAIQSMAAIRKLVAYTLKRRSVREDRASAEIELRNGLVMMAEEGCDVGEDCGSCYPCRSRTALLRADGAPPPEEAGGF